MNHDERDCIANLFIGLLILVVSMLVIRLSVSLRWYYLVSFLVVFVGVVGLALIVTGKKGGR